MLTDFVSIATAGGSCDDDEAKNYNNDSNFYTYNNSFHQRRSDDGLIAANDNNHPSSPAVEGMSFAKDLSPSSNPDFSTQLSSSAYYSTRPNNSQLQSSTFGKCIHRCGIDAASQLAHRKRVKLVKSEEISTTSGDGGGGGYAFPFQSKGLGKTLTAVAILVIMLCGGGIQLSSATVSSSQENVNSARSTNSDSISSSASSFDSINNKNYYVDNDPLVPQQPSSRQSSSSSLSSPSVRAVSTRPISDISTTSSDGDNSVPSHYGNCRRYDVCPNGDAWCSSLDESEKLALEAIHALHHQLDDDKNGNIDLFESNEFLREELKYDRDYEKRQENFHRNNDNQVSVKELWETWVRSEVHNWTVDQTVDWIGTYVGLPHYQEKFIQLEINGTYLPRLAVNLHNFLSINLGIKDVITRQKLTLKAQDVVLFGSPRDNTNRTKDAILTTLLVVAVTVCYLVYCRYKSSQRDLSRMSKDMEALMKAEETLHDLQKEMEQAKSDQEIRDKEAVTHRSSADDEDELIRLRDEVIVLRNELQRAEVELQDKCWVPPPALTHWLQLTYELESKAHSKKRQSAEKQLKQAKEACDKLKKKRSSLMGAFVATHARSIDDVDKAILEARAALTEVTQELQERMNRWKQIEMLVKSPIVNNPGLASLEILLRAGSRVHPYLGAGSVMSNSQDDIDDDGASSIYCPSAVSGPITNIHAPIARSKSVQSMLSLREHRGFNRESSSKDSSNGEEEIMMGNDAAEITAKDRRVTFRAAADRRSGQLRSFQGRPTGPQQYDPKEFDETRNFYARKPPLSASRLEGPKSSEEESHHQRKKQLKEEPDLIPIENHNHHHSTHANNNNVIEEETNSIGSEPEAQSEISHSNHHPQHNFYSHNNTPFELQQPAVVVSEEEPNNSLLINNKPKVHEQKPVTISLEGSPPPKMSFFKKISKLMRFPHHTHGGNEHNVFHGKRASIKSSKKEQNCGHSEERHGTKSNNVTAAAATVVSMKSNNLKVEKTLLPDTVRKGGKNDEDNNVLPAKPLKPQKKSQNFFSTLRRSNKHVETSKPTEFTSS